MKWLRHLIFLFVSFPLGVILYFCIGVAVPRITNLGRFYSVPFGGYTVGDTPILLSLLFWIALIFAALTWIFRPRR